MSVALKGSQERFVRTWGEMASRWGINKTMARIHALLMASDAALSTDEIMEALSISRGNANMNLRALVDWGLVKRVDVGGERKEYFQSEKDVWNMCCRIARERKKREIEPVIGALEECLKEAGTGKDAAAFRRKLLDLLELVRMLDFVLGKVGQQEKNAVLPKVLTLMKAMG
ncbi:MAG: helix-turn-helix domain-containing protein [Elusimicrobia bacterium]|nr:helix-turn-helix domain-containing protein [Elusimicrobiota bacterium]